MKGKYILRGFGIGLILAVAVICLGYELMKADGYRISVDRSQDTASPSETLRASDEEKTETTAVTTEKVTDTEIRQLTTENTTEKLTTEHPTTEQTTTERATTERATTEQKKTEEQTTTEQPTEAPATTAEITVVSGMGSDQIAELLQQAGLVEDASSYDLWLIRNGYANRMEVGTFSIPVGSSYETIAEILTTRGR